MNKRRILLLAVVLGVLLGTGLALLNLNLPPSTSTTSTASVQCPTSVVQKVVEDSAQTIADKPVVATNIATKVQPPEPPKPPKPPKPSNPPKPVTYLPHVPKARQVLLANRRIVVEEGRSFPKTFCAAQTPTARGTAPYIVISEKPVNRDVRIQAVANGAKVIGFLPNNALLVEADAEALKNLEEDATFLAAVEYEPTDKIQRRVLEADTPSIETTIVLLNEKDRETVIQFVTSSGGKMLPAPSKKSLAAEIKPSLVTELAKKAEVRWIEHYARLKINNDVAVKPGLMNVTPIREAPLGLTGDGQIITTCDTGIDYEHEDFATGLLGYDYEYTESDSTDLNGHGTHTAGSIIGSGAKSNGKYKGVAPGAKLWAWFGGYYGGDDVYFPYYWDAKKGYFFASDMVFRPRCDASYKYDEEGDELFAHIHSGSYGGDVMGGYSYTYCVQVDEYVWNHPDYLPVFSAGNNNHDVETTVDQPATAKNVMAVGASESYRPTKGPGADDPAQIADFSSCGPCQDGRIKPDLVAPGTYIVSCRSMQASKFPHGICEENENYAYDCGTSMATPLVAGSAALVREWLAKYRNMPNPSAALVKAILTGGANGGETPDNTFGWGRADIGESIAPTNGLAVYLKDWLPFARNEEFVFHVTTTNRASLAVQLVWIDYPATAGVGRTLVNDLDLTVKSVITGVQYGNGGAEPDDLNTGESVRLHTANPATYEVTVSCPAILPHDHTEGGAAALYIRGAFDPKTVIEGDMPVLFYLAKGLK